MDNKAIPIIEESKKAIVTNQFPNKSNNNLAIISLVFGIISFLVCWTFVAPVILGLIGVIVGIISLIKKCDGSIIATAGIITSLVGLVIGLALSTLSVIDIFL